MKRIIAKYDYTRGPLGAVYAYAYVVSLRRAPLLPRVRDTVH